MASLYSRFYRLREDPFNLTPDPKFFYPSAAYQEALMGVLYGITQRRGIIALTGEVGVGKTTILYKVQENLGPSVHVVFLPNSRAAFGEILEYLLQELGLPPQPSKLAMFRQLKEFLVEELRRGGNLVLFIDEAQSLERQEMEDLRLLSNIETPEAKLLQIVFAGQPEFQERLKDPALRQLRQRIAVHCRLQPLGLEEVGNYIRTRLEIAGVKDPGVFSGDAVAVIAQRAQGIPRLINLACDQALLTAYSLGCQRIDRDILEEALADVLPDPPRPLAAMASPAQTGEVDKPSSLSPRDELVRGGGVLSEGRSPPLAPSRRFALPITVAVLVSIVGAGAYLAFGRMPVRVNQNGSIDVRVASILEEPVPAKADDLRRGEASRDRTAPVSREESEPGKNLKSEGKVFFLLREKQEVITLPAEMTVRPGDTLVRMAAQRYGQVTPTMLDLLRIANPDVANINRLQVGQRLAFPDLHGAVRVFAEEGGAYSYLLLSTPSKKEALYYSNLLVEKGHSVKIVLAPVSPNGLFYRVLASGFRSKQAAADGGAPLAHLIARKPRL